jgi:copper chaperone CopZ
MKNRMGKFLIIMVMIGLIAAGCSDKDVSARNPVFGKTVKKQVLDKIVNRTTMKVDKLSCGSCLTAIGQKLDDFEGVVGMGADLSHALVAVDHTKSLESKKIAEAITSIGYPAKILSVEEIDSSKAFVPSNPSQYGRGGGCCSTAGPANTTSEIKGNDPNFSSNGNSYAAGCPYVESVRSRGCPSSSSWKELVQRFSDKKEKKDDEVK